MEEENERHKEAVDRLNRRRAAELEQEKRRHEEASKLEKELVEQEKERHEIALQQENDRHERAVKEIKSKFPAEVVQCVEELELQRKALQKAGSNKSEAMDI